MSTKTILCGFLATGALTAAHAPGRHQHLHDTTTTATALSARSESTIIPDPDCTMVEFRGRYPWLCTSSSQTIAATQVVTDVDTTVVVVTATAVETTVAAAPMDYSQQASEIAADTPQPTYNPPVAVSTAAVSADAVKSYSTAPADASATTLVRSSKNHKTANAGASTASTSASGDSTTNTADAAAGSAGGNKLPAGATPFTKVVNPSGAPAIPKPTSDFSVDTYWGGSGYPFVLSHDKAPKMTGQDYVDLHNQYRKLHVAKPMVLNQTLQEEVNGWVDKCYPTDPHAGSNWYAGSDAPEDALFTWYNERGNYAALSNDFTVTTPNSAKCENGTEVHPPETGHFTQMVWDDSTSVACASKLCPHASGQWNIHICLYHPAGNMGFNDEPTYLYNVFRPSQ